MPKRVATVFVEARLDPKSLAQINTQLRSALATGTGVGPFNTQTRAVAALTTSQSKLSSVTKTATRSLHEQADVIERNSSQMNRFSRGVASTGLSMFGLRGATLAATSAFLAGAAAITAIGKAVGIATSFNSQIAVFGAVTGATAEQLRQVAEASRELGRDPNLPGVSARDAAEAMTELAKAGLSVQDAIAGTRGVLLLAKAANIDNAQATELAAGALNAFSLSGDKAIQVADTLANAANLAQGSIVDIGIAFQQAAAIGHQAGLTFQDTTGFITSLAKAGLTGSDAGTSLRTAIIRLINPTKKAGDIIERLGLQLRDAEGNLRPDIFVQIGKAIQGLTKAQQDQILATIGGQDAVRAFSILSRQSIQDLLAQRKALHDTGTAAEVGSARMVGLAGAGAQLSNTIEDIALSLGQRATPALTSFTESVTNTITAISQSPLVTGTLSQGVHAVGEAFGALGTTVQSLAPVVATLASSLNAVTSTVGVGNILAFVVALKAMNVAIKAIAVNRLFAAFGLGGGGLVGSGARVVSTLRQMTAGLAEFRIGLGLAALSVTGFLTSLTGIAVVGAAVGAGLFFLFTRTGQMEQATKRLKQATEDLIAAQNNSDDAGAAVQRARLAAATDRAALAEERLALARARTALARSNAPEGSLEREALTSDVLLKQQQVGFLQEQLATDAKNIATARAQQAAAEEMLARQLKNEAAALDEVAAAAEKRARIDERTNLITSAEAATRDKVVQKLKEERDALLASAAAGDQNAIAERERLELLAGVIARVKDLSQLKSIIHVGLDAKDAEAAARQLEGFLRSSGQTAAANWLLQWQLTVNPQNILSPLGNLPGLFAALGARSGSSFASALISFINQALAQALLLIRNATITASAALSNQTETLLLNLSEIQARGGTLQQQLAAAKAAEAKAEQALNALKPGQKTGDIGEFRKQRERAINDLASARGAVTSIESQIAAEQKAAAGAAEKASNDAQKALDDADQAFLNAMGLRRGGLDIQGAKAELTDSLEDDIKFQDALQVFFRREIIAARKSIHDALLLAQTVQSLTLALFQSQKAKRDLVRQQKENKKQRIITKRDNQEESLELNIQIAQTQENKDKELQAHKALLRFLIQRQKHTTAGTVEWRRYQLKIEEQKAAIREANKSLKETNLEAQKLFFTFLTTQSGFVQNLLGNLIPRGATAGLVGGGTSGGTVFSTSTSSDIPAANFAAAVHQRGAVDAGLTSSAQAGTAPRGASMGQMATLIHLVHQLVVLQQRANGQRTHPEVGYRTYTSSTELNAAG